MHNPISVMENDTHKRLWDFDIQTDRPFSARRPDLIIINKKKKRICKIVDFAVLAKSTILQVLFLIKLKESEKKDKYLDLARKLMKLEYKSDNYIDCNWCSWYSHQRINKGFGGLGNERTSGSHLNYCIIEIGQNTEKSPGHLRRPAVTQTSVKDHKRYLMGKTQGLTNNDNLFVHSFIWFQAFLSNTRFDFFVLSHINLCRLFNTEDILLEEQ